MLSRRLPLTALAAALALGACNQAPQTTDNAQVDVGNASEPDNAAFDQAPVIENADDAGAVTVAAVPKPAAGTPAADAAPVNDAVEIEQEIRAGTGIQRIRYGEGWAWTRNGRIVRTADRDGNNIAYFRQGQTNPFFVQRGDRSYAYRDGRPVREFDRDGRARAPDTDRAREATEAANRAREQRDHAEQARDHARPGRDHDRNGRPERPGASPTPTPSPTPPSTARWPRDRDGGSRSSDGDRRNDGERDRPDRDRDN